MPGASFAQAEKVCGTFQDQSGASVAGAGLELRTASNRLSASTDAAGAFCFDHVVPGEYELSAQARGFQTNQKNIIVHSGESLHLIVSLNVETAAQQVTVAEGSADLGSVNVAQTQVGPGLIANLPSESVNAALSSILTLTTPGVAADSNGVFHPLGEHAETSFSIDGQPISDQQSRIFSNQISASTLQEMRTLQGAPPAEFGDKTSLIVEATTRSGLNAGKPTGTISLAYGSFDTPTASITLGSGRRTFGNFLALDGLNSHRFLDTPEFQPLHARGNAENVFDRFDWQPSDATSVHVNISAARSWFQVPNTYDQQAAGQDQRQHMTSFNAGVGVFPCAQSLALAHREHMGAAGPRELFPVGQCVFRSASNALSIPKADEHGIPKRPDVFPWTALGKRRRSVPGRRPSPSSSDGPDRSGIQFSLCGCERSFRPKCRADVLPNQCAAAGYAQNSAYQPALLPYDLTRGGTLFAFRGAATIYEGERLYLRTASSSANST